MVEIKAAVYNNWCKRQQLLSNSARDMERERERERERARENNKYEVVYNVQQYAIVECRPVLKQ